ncbi:MAG: HipA N-terminal domain-containing protein [Melioribacteraceae bacterium]|nr:HipA N-terminal domain-containing protein [Melioribacteraceae bacterium]MCF8354875.1 HipA N-terminal domain-containing protein [Melioribacteraceae bacterium]MCF8393903.1 HipA N-terminal domain-containing protein [Melioribacteraceae bacterium]MCF8419675.1 HipA N-terminal domain-containing protein [Melioribacteraceae bacterium]
MRKAKVYNYGIPVGELHELEMNSEYRFTYFDNYNGKPISLTMPVKQKEFAFDSFPPFFEGLLPEGVMLESLLRTAKIDADDLFLQLLYVGEDLVGSVTVEEIR